MFGLQEDLARLLHGALLVCLAVSTVSPRTSASVFSNVAAGGRGVSLASFIIFAHALAARYDGLLFERSGVLCTPDDIMDAVVPPGGRAGAAEFDMHQVCHCVVFS